MYKPEKDEGLGASQLSEEANQTSLLFALLNLIVIVIIVVFLDIIIVTSSSSSKFFLTLFQMNGNTFT